MKFKVKLIIDRTPDTADRSEATWHQLKVPRPPCQVEMCRQSFSSSKTREKERETPAEYDFPIFIKDHIILTRRRGVQKKSAKILTMEAKAVKTKKRTKSVKKREISTISCDYFDSF